MTNPALAFAICLLARSGLAGVVLFVLPPFAEHPPDWQIGLAFVAWIGWCYRRGLLGSQRLPVAAIESVPALWLSLKWTQLLVFATQVAQEG